MAFTAAHHGTFARDNVREGDEQLPERREERLGQRGQRRRPSRHRGEQGKRQGRVGGLLPGNGIRCCRLEAAAPELREVGMRRDVA